MIFKPRKFRILKSLINMKFYLAIAFALLMATAYGIRNKVDATATSGVAVGSTTAQDTCDEPYIYEYSNGYEDCKVMATYCEEVEGTSTDHWEDVCEEASSYISDCSNTYDPVDWLWYTSNCTISECYEGVCSECSNIYNEDWTQYPYDFHHANQCKYADGSSDCKLLAYIFFFFMYLL
jgi:hypothetical protein